MSEGVRRRSIPLKGRLPMERMFDKDSFTEEIQNAADAQACVDYLSRNERNFRKELMAEGLSHEQEEQAVKEVWTNLIKSCRRVGFRDEWVDEKARKYGVK